MTGLQKSILRNMPRPWFVGQVSLAMGTDSLSELTGKQIFGRLTIDI
jgi:hypothetical protein